jgi:CubicO group peptidase (beta-lactamase class C family)
MTVIPPAFQGVDKFLQQAAQQTAPAIQLVVRQAGQVCFTGAYGWLDPRRQERPTTLSSRFDLASVTKLFVATAFMRLVDQGAVALDQPVSTVLSEFGGARPLQPYEDPLQSGALITVVDAPPGTTVDADRVTFRHLLTHSAGLPAWRPLFQQADATQARQMALQTFFSAPIGGQVIYSDIGLILLGLSVEELTGQSLAAAVATSVLAPLHLSQTDYLPGATGQATAGEVDIAPTEFCRWRQRRVCGQVHDENAAQLGGVSGHAGLFSTAGDVARFGQLFLDGGQVDETHRLLRAETVAAMRQVQVERAETRRGLGFLLWSPDPLASSNPFSTRAFGHTGFTGTSLWMDPERALVVALLTNEVYHGRQNRGIAELRVAVHRAVVAAVDGAA